MSNTREAVQIDRIRNNIEAAYIALEALGITVPEGATVDELAALINDAAAAHLDSVMDKRIVQTTGTATDKVMSQKAVTEAIDAAKPEITNAVIAHFGGQPIVGVVGDDKSIVLSGSLGEGTYTLKYDGVDGAYSDIVTLTITAEDQIKYTNVLPLAQEYASTNPYVGADGSVGYGNNMRISTSSPATTYMKAQTGVDTTAMIPAKRGDVLRFKNCNLKVTPSNTSYGTHIFGFDSSKAIVSSFSILYNNLANRLPIVTDGDEIVEITLEPLPAWTTSNIDDVAYVMIGTDGLDETSIITINQEIV